MKVTVTIVESDDNYLVQCNDGCYYLEDTGDESCLCLGNEESVDRILDILRDVRAKHKEIGIE